MIETLVDIPTADGRIDTFVTRPQEGGPFPLVVLYMDIWGLREELFEIARRIATTGYVCAVPNFYYREGRVRYDTRNAQNKVVSVDRLEPAVRGVMLGSRSRLTNARPSACMAPRWFPSGRIRRMAISRRCGASCTVASARRTRIRRPRWWRG